MFIQAATQTRRRMTASDARDVLVASGVNMRQLLRRSRDLPYSTFKTYCSTGNPLSPRQKDALAMALERYLDSRSPDGVLRGLITELKAGKTQETDG